jgi:hypothetical protein
MGPEEQEMGSNTHASALRDIADIPGRGDDFVKLEYSKDDLSDLTIAEPIEDPHAWATGRGEIPAEAAYLQEYGGPRSREAAVRRNDARR